MGELIKSLKNEKDQLKGKNKELQQFLDIQKHCIEKNLERVRIKNKSIPKSILN